MDIIIEEEFPTLEDFKNVVAEERSKAISFKELPLHTVFEISEFKKVVVKGRNAIIITLLDSKRKVTEVWATSLLMQDIESNRDGKWQGKKLYIISKGKKDSKNPNRKFYYDFKIIYK